MFKFTDFVGAFTKRRKPAPNPAEPRDRPRIIEASGNADLTETETGLIYGDIGLRTDNVDRNCCPDCRHEKFYAGPQGGGAQNYRCALCGMGYNLTGGLGDHRIGLPHHLWNSKVKTHRSTLRALLAEHGFETSDENWGIKKDDHHGIWGWPTHNFATIPADDTTLLLWTLDVFKWKKHTLQLPDPDFIQQHAALTDDSSRIQ